MPVHLAMYILAVDAFQIKEEVRQNAPSYFKEKHSSAFSLNGLKALFPKLHFQYFLHIISIYIENIQADSALIHYIKPL